MTALKLAATNTAAKIDKGVPLPTRIPRASVWPLSEMDVGDSFAVPDDKFAAVRAALTYEKSKHPNRTYTLRRLPNENRCWRIA